MNRHLALGNEEKRIEGKNLSLARIEYSAELLK